MKRIPRGIPCLIIVLLFFGYLSSVMGLSNMLNTLMHTAHGLLLNTVFYLMGICVLTGALAKLFTEFGVVDMLQYLLRPIIRPLYNLPGVSVLACVMTFLSDNPAIISLTKNKKFASYFKVYQFISLANFGTAFGMGFLVIVFMIGQGFFGAPFIGLIGAALGGVVATRMMQHLVLKAHPEFRDMDVVKPEDMEGDNALGASQTQKYGTFTRVLNALLDGGKSGVEIGLAIIPGILIICTIVMMLTFGGTVEGVDENGQDIIVYTGGAYQGTQLLPWLAGKISFVFKWLFGFTSPELIAFPITALGTVGAALSLVPEFVNKGVLDGNAVAVFTAMGMCWSGFLSSHTAMLDSLGYRDLLTKDFLSQTVGGLCAGFIAHWLYAGITALALLFAPDPVWNADASAQMCNIEDTTKIEVTMLDDGSYLVHDWYGAKGCDLAFTVNAEDSTVNITNSYTNKDEKYFFVHINENALQDEIAYAALFPGKPYSEFVGNEKGGHFFVFAFIYDGARRLIDRGYYELVWGEGMPETVEMEAAIKADIQAEKDSIEASKDSVAAKKDSASTAGQ